MQANRATRRSLLAFACSAAATSTALVSLGWLTGIRQVMHGALLALAVVAFLPFVLIVAALMLGVGLTLLVIFFGIFAGGDPVPIAPDVSPLAEGGAWLVPRYYRFWANRRHPALWGVPFGVLAGCLLLAALIVALVLPGEAKTVRALEEAQRRVEAYYAREGRHPTPDARGRLARAAFEAGPKVGDGILGDGFGRPFLYQVSGRGRIASYAIKSLGFDGSPGRDDLCVAGRTNLKRWADAAGIIARHVQVERPGVGRAVLDRLKKIQSMRCEE